MHRPIDDVVVVERERLHVCILYLVIEKEAHYLGDPSAQCIVVANKL